MGTIDLRGAFRIKWRKISMETIADADSQCEWVLMVYYLHTLTDTQWPLIFSVSGRLWAFL